MIYLGFRPLAGVNYNLIPKEGLTPNVHVSVPLRG